MGPAAAKLVPGHWNASIFPNCSYLIGEYVFKVWHPLGPDSIEIVSWSLVEKEMPDDLKRRIRSATQRTFGPAGMLEADDIDNFEYITKPNRGYVTRQGRLNLQLAMGKERVDPDFPGVLGDYLSEHGQRGFYRTYADCLSTNSWQELEAATATWKEDLLRK